ncbi:MAG: lysylphosphatidylglycerol synthase transmembrane domain-containing protein, partial [Candidatus Aquicultor sp.]|nr:lysylphosphatidylglycerol synthase transmembrane domain-containing protein [Candidatus Aquicultor sp.]
MELTQKLSQLQKKGQSRYVALLKAAISVSLIGALLAKSDLDKYTELISNSSPLYLGLALLITVVSIVLSAYKWQLLVIAQGFSVPLRQLISSYFVGLFFNNFMPTSIGGDVVRVLDLRKMTSSGPAAAASVVAERVLAAFTLGLIVLCGVAFGTGVMARYRVVILVFVGICALALLGILYAHRLAPILSRYEASIAGKLKETAESIRSSVENKNTLVKVLFYSFIFQLMVVSINVFIIKALGLHVPIAFVFLFIPIIFAITMLPISMNGLGLREATYAYFFAQAGLSTEESVTISLL